MSARSRLAARAFTAAALAAAVAAACGGDDDSGGGGAPVPPVLTVTSPSDGDCVELVRTSSGAFVFGVTTRVTDWDLRPPGACLNSTCGTLELTVDPESGGEVFRAATTRVEARYDSVDAVAGSRTLRLRLLDPAGRALSTDAYPDSERQLRVTVAAPGACGTPGDAGSDAGMDASSDAAADSGADAGNDASSDGGADAGSDAATDASADAADSGTDAADAAADASNDAAADASDAAAGDAAAD